MGTTEEALVELREVRADLAHALAMVDLEIAWLSPTAQPERFQLPDQHIRKLLGPLYVEDI